MSEPATELSLEEIARVAKALSDPTRLRMLAALSKGRSCCGLPEPSGRGLAKRAEPEEGVCVCELQEQFGLIQSKVSYHLRVLQSAGLIDVHERGKWSFYFLRREGVEVLRDHLDAWLARPSRP